MSEPVICFGQQPCGFFPKRFFHAKLVTARRLQREIGGRIVWFCHDSDHDYRETATPLRDLKTGELARINFDHVGKLQKKYTPLYAKRIQGDWQERTARLLPRFVPPALVDLFRAVQAGTVADFCLDMYRRLGHLEGVEVVRSSEPGLRARAVEVADFYVDVLHEGELVRARCRDGKLTLHRGGDEYLELPYVEPAKETISPARDTRLRWMQSVVRCTHYVAGAGEAQYLKREETPEITFVARESIDRADESFVEVP
ncbi:MAG: hypothetical protein ACRD5D_06295 [Candidatus Polarisedimenticolia bacterium]